MAYVTGVNSGNLQVMPTAMRMPTLNYGVLDLGDMTGDIAKGIKLGQSIVQYKKNRENELAMEKAKIEAAQALAKQQQAAAEKASATLQSEISSTVADNTLTAAEKTQKLQILDATDKQAKATALSAANTNQILAASKEKLAPVVTDTAAVEAGTANVRAKGVAKRLPVTESIEDLSAESSQKIVSDIKEKGFSDAPGGKYVAGPKGPTFVANKLTPAWGQPYKNESTGQWEQQGELADGRVTTKVVPAPKMTESMLNPTAKKDLLNYSAFGYKADQNAASDLNKAAEFFESGRAKSTDVGVLGGVTSAIAGKFDPSLKNVAKSEEAKNVAMMVKEFGASKLKQAFGAQLSDGEREFLMETLEDPTASAATKAKRFRVLAERMSDYSEAKKAQADYFAQNGSLEGFSGPNPDEIKGSVTADVSGVKGEGEVEKPSEKSETIVNIGSDGSVSTGRKSAKKLEPESPPTYLKGEVRSQGVKPAKSAGFDPSKPSELVKAGVQTPTAKETYDEVQARYDAGKATDAEFDAARSAYTKEHGLGERIAHTWNDAKIGSSVWDFIKSVSKGGYALTPMGIEQNAERATSAEIANLQNEADAKLITKAMQDAIASGDVETAKAIAEGRIKTPRAVSRGEEAILKAKNTGKEVAASLVGAVHGGGDVIMAVPAAISKGAEEVALAAGADETAAALNRGRRDIVGTRESGISTMGKAVGGSEDSLSGGRLVGGAVIPVSVPGVQAALKAAGTVARPVGQVVQKAVDVVSPATRKAFEATAALAGEASENLISGGMDAATAGTAAATLAIAPKVVSIPMAAAATGALTSRNALAGVGKYPRALKSYVTHGAGGLSGMASKVYELSGNAYAKIKDSLVTPSQMVGDISTAAVGKAEGSLLGDLTAGGKQAATDLSSKIDALKKVRNAEILEGKTHATVTQSNLENLSARLKSVEMGNKFLDSMNKIGGEQLLNDLHGKLGDAITYSVMGAGVGTALAYGMTENPIESGGVPGAMLGAAVALLGNGVRSKTLPDGSEELTLDHDVVRNGAADLVEAAAKEAPEPAPRSVRDIMLDAIDQQGYYDEVNPNGSTTRYVRTDRGIEGKLLPVEEPAAAAVEHPEAAPEPILRKPGSLKIKPGTMTNKAVVKAAEVRKGKLKPASED